MSHDQSERLIRWLHQALNIEADTSLSITPLLGGRSNLNYAISDGTTEWILRRPPEGPLLPKAHDMLREYTVLRALQNTGVPVPSVAAYCDDLSVIGVHFYVMERVPGQTMERQESVDRLSLAEAADCSRSLIATLAALHAVTYADVGLSQFGRPAGFLNRQLDRWSDQWRRATLAGSPAQPAVVELHRRLLATVPRSDDASLLHGDFKLDNVMFAADDPTRVVAVLDWELAALGDPLTDLGLYLLYATNEAAQRVSGGALLRAHAGFWSRRDIIDGYQLASGARLDGLEWHELFAFYKLAVITAGIYVRTGAARPDDLAGISHLIDALAQGGLEHAAAASPRGRSPRG